MVCLVCLVPLGWEPIRGGRGTYVLILAQPLRRQLDLLEKRLRPLMEMLRRQLEMLRKQLDLLEMRCYLAGSQGFQVDRVGAAGFGNEVCRHRRRPMAINTYRPSFFS